ncbi:Lrp/AsnC family transcriptional regulator [Thalassospira sp. MCCC 1A03138]|uniref:Lrp/AsnC family transcriptional regulator n=1 Tax=Thalassospira sp. MCCC 1A03138 TaxID=1470576 RepID=UPI000A1FD17C|nr:Lrp/AsnC family transcriptional regulator [Thalassospira sp. MCCC 1A03138]OSQ30311.1 hypothetical protein TH468_12795 [Thalassospira sp. MCCC 1A03138]
MIKIDEINLKILRALQANAKLTNLALSKLVGLSPSPCLDRVKRLEKEAVVKRYRAVLDIEKICPHVRVFAEVTLTGKTAADYKRFADAAKTIPEVVAAYRISGPYDYMLCLVCRDVQHYHSLSEDMIHGNLGITKFIGHVALAQTKAFKGYPV